MPEINAEPQTPPCRCGGARNLFSEAQNAVQARGCDLCGVGAGQQCRNPINPESPLPGRPVHFGRLEAR